MPTFRGMRFTATCKSLKNITVSNFVTLEVLCHTEDGKVLGQRAISSVEVRHIAVSTVVSV